MRKQIISASRLLERGHKLVLKEKPRIQCQNGDVIALGRCGSLRAAARLNVNRDMNRKLAISQNEERMRNIHAVWLVPRASDWPRGGADEAMDLTGLESRWTLGCLEEEARSTIARGT